MKIQGDFQKTVTIEQVRNGYITSTPGLGESIPMVHRNFEEAVNEIAFQFGLRGIGERVLISATKERQETEPVKQQP